MLGTRAESSEFQITKTFNFSTAFGVQTKVPGARPWFILLEHDTCHLNHAREERIIKIPQTLQSFNSLTAPREPSNNPNRR